MRSWWSISADIMDELCAKRTTGQGPGQWRLRFCQRDDWLRECVREARRLIKQGLSYKDRQQEPLKEGRYLRWLVSAPYRLPMADAIIEEFQGLCGIIGAVKIAQERDFEDVFLTVKKYLDAEQTTKPDAEADHGSVRRCPSEEETLGGCSNAKEDE